MNPAGLPTTADYAMSAADDARRAAGGLARRVEELEKQVAALTDAVDTMAERLGIKP